MASTLLRIEGYGWAGHLTDLPSENVDVGWIRTRRTSLRSGKKQELLCRKLTRGELNCGSVITELLPGDWEWDFSFIFYSEGRRFIVDLPLLVTGYEENVENVREVVAFEQEDGWLVTWKPTKVNARIGVIVLKKLGGYKKYVKVDPKESWVIIRQTTEEMKAIEEMGMRVRRGRQWSRWVEVKMVNVKEEWELAEVKALPVGSRQMLKRKQLAGVGDYVVKRLKSKDLGGNRQLPIWEWGENLRAPLGKKVINFNLTEEYMRRSKMRKVSLEERKVDGVNGTVHREGLYFPSIQELGMEYNYEQKAFRSERMRLYGKVFEGDEQVGDIRQAVKEIQGCEVIMFDTESSIVRGKNGTKNSSTLASIQVGYRKQNGIYIYIFLWGQLRSCRALVATMFTQHQEWVGFATGGDQGCIEEMGGQISRLTDVQERVNGESVGLVQAWLRTLEAERSPEVQVGLYKLKACVHHMFKTGAWCVPPKGQLFGSGLWGQPGLIEYAMADVWMVFDIWDERDNLQLLG